MNCIGRCREILLIIDMEGCIGLFDMGNQEQCKGLMLNEVDAILSSFSNERNIVLTIVDAHNTGNNILELSKKYSYYSFVGGLWNIKNLSKYDKAVLVGFHAKQGSNGLFAHTFRSEIKEITYGSLSLGEVGTIVLWLRENGIPTVFISGTRSLENEIKDLNMSELYYCEKEDEQSNEEVSQDYDLDYARLTSTMKKMVRKEDPKMCCYYHDTLCMRFYRGIDMEFLPYKLFDMDGNKIVFATFDELFDKMYELSLFLIATSLYLKKKINKLHHLIKSKMTKDQLHGITNERIRNILSTKNYYDVNYEELQYLLAYFESVKND